MTDTAIVIGLVVAMVVALAAWLLRRYRVSVHRADVAAIDDLIRRKGAGADPLLRSGVIVFTNQKEPR